MSGQQGWSWSFCAQQHLSTPYKEAREGPFNKAQLHQPALCVQAGGLAAHANQDTMRCGLPPVLLMSLQRGLQGFLEPEGWMGSWKGG